MWAMTALGVQETQQKWHFPKWILVRASLILPLYHSGWLYGRAHEIHGCTVKVGIEWWIARWKYQWLNYLCWEKFVMAKCCLTIRFGESLFSRGIRNDSYGHSYRSSRTRNMILQRGSRYKIFDSCMHSECTQDRIANRSKVLLDKNTPTQVPTMLSLLIRLSFIELIE